MITFWIFDYYITFQQLEIKAMQQDAIERVQDHSAGEQEHEQGHSAGS